MHTPESEVATGFALQSSYSLPFHARSASWWLSRFGPFAPHFGQTPWNWFSPTDRILPRAFRQNGQSRVYRTPVLAVTPIRAASKAFAGYGCGRRQKIVY